MVRQSALAQFVGISLVVLVLIGLASGATAQEPVSVQLDPVGESGVSGTATLNAAGEGTDFTLDVEGLAAGMEAQATMQAGTCEMPSASFATLPVLTADATGSATATGAVLFRGTEDVALATMADGEHIIAIQADGEVVACGVIPALSSAPTAPTLPATSGIPVSLVAIGAGILGWLPFLRVRSSGEKGTEGEQVNVRARGQRVEAGKEGAGSLPRREPAPNPGQLCWPCLPHFAGAGKRRLKPARNRLPRSCQRATASVCQ